MSVRLKVVDPETDKKWDDFVCAQSQGSVYHHSAWTKVLESTYGYHRFCVALENDTTDKFEGIVPFLLVKSRLTGQRLVSLPFTTYCDRLIPQRRLESVIGLASEHHPGIDYVEFKFLRSLDGVSDSFVKQTGYVTHVLSLDGSLEQLFRSFHDTSVRQRIKRAEKYNLTLRMAEEEKDVKKFYELETMVRKKHGLPPQPYAFFANLWFILKPKNFLAVPLIEHKGKVIAAAIVLKFKDTVYFEYSASDQDSLKLCPNQKLIWEVIKMACTEGFKHFDFGRSAVGHRSLIEFKERWGAKRRELLYYYWPKAKRIDTENGPGRRILCLANRILPCGLLKLEGRLIHRHLG
jgi:lipid II:glycine glycyltransferase (peptidoglycan interpeptide bridge formation enzyme)